MVRHQNRRRFFFSNDPGVYGVMFTFDAEQFVAQTMQQLESSVDWLGDPMNVQQAEPTLKRNRWKVILGENIAEGPKGITLHEPCRFHNDLGGICGGKGFVVQRVAGI